MSLSACGTLLEPQPGCGPGPLSLQERSRGVVHGLPDRLSAMHDTCMSITPADRWHAHTTPCASPPCLIEPLLGRGHGWQCNAHWVRSSSLHPMCSDTSTVYYVPVLWWSLKSCLVCQPCCSLCILFLGKKHLGCSSCVCWFLVLLTPRVSVSRLLLRTAAVLAAPRMVRWNDTGLIHGMRLATGQLPAQHACVCGPCPAAATQFTPTCPDV